MQGSLNRSSAVKTSHESNEANIEAPLQHPAETDSFATTLAAVDQGSEPSKMANPGYVRKTSEGICLADAPDDDKSVECGGADGGAIENESSESDFSQVDAEMIRNATEAAIDDAIAMKRSDSILSMESDEDVVASRRKRRSSSSSESSKHESSLGNIHKQGREGSICSERYMEEASFEAAIAISGSGRIIPHGSLQAPAIDSRDLLENYNQSHLNNGDLEEYDSSTWDDMVSPSQRRASERDVFKSTSRLGPDAFHFLETIVSADDGDILDEDPQTTNNSLMDILRDCELLIPEDTSSDDRPTEVHLLHLLFKGFCRPSISIDAVETIFTNEKTRSTIDVELPLDVVIEKPTPSLFRLLGAPSLLQLPREWAFSLFRILLRLLTNESDAEYDAAVLKSCTWYDQTNGSPPKNLERSSSTSSPKNQSSFSDQSIKGAGNETKKSNQLYSIVRLRRTWKSAVSQLLDSLEVILKDSNYEHLVGPTTRLLGLLCTCGVSVEELQRILALASENKSSPMTQLHLVRALRNAAAGASRSYLGKADPRTFFSFFSGRGIVRPINLEKSSWPFKNDFGMALWFRAEKFKDTSSLLRVANEAGDGTEVSLLPLSKTDSDTATAMVLAISVFEGGKSVECVKISNCILHERVWYHVAVRHTRSRLKGMFSLGPREQLSVILDGKVMATETLKFPQIKESSSKMLTLTFGANFDGQTGALYVFHNNVSDATLKALHEITSGPTKNILPRRSSGFGDWDSRQGLIVRKSKVLDLDMRHDDMEDVVLSYRANENDNRQFAPISDLDEEDESLENGPLSKDAFNTRLYVVWDPTRTEGTVALELHSGAHARMDPENVQQWTVEGVQDVLGSLGGIQVVLPFLRSLLSGRVENEWSNHPGDAHSNLQRYLLCSSVPDVIFLLSSLVQDHHENARETLRCGAIDLLEQALQANKQLGVEHPNRFPVPSLVSSPCVFPSLSYYLISALLELRSTCSHYVGLETKVFSRLLFNLPLWLGGPCRGVAVISDIIPILSSVAMQYPDKIRDCVGVKGVLKVLVDFVEVDSETSIDQSIPFDRNIQNIDDLLSCPSPSERWHVSDALFAILFQVWVVGSTADEVAFVVNTLSNYLGSEWETASKEVAEDVENLTRSGPRETRYRFSLRASTLILLLLEMKPPPRDFLRHLARACGSAQAGAAWILCTLVNTFCDRIRAIGVRCIVAYLDVTGSNSDFPLVLEDLAVTDIEKAKIPDSRTLQENTISLISNVSHGLMNSNVGRGLASIGPTMRSKLQAPPKVTSRVAYQLLWHLLKSHRYRIFSWTQGSIVAIVFDRRHQSSELLNSALQARFLRKDSIFLDTLTIDWDWVESLMQDRSVPFDASVRGHLGLNTALRLLRFLPDEFIDQWLSDLLWISERSTTVLEIFSSTPDWQSCIFQLSSDLVEKIASASAKQADPVSATNLSSATSPALDAHLHFESNRTETELLCTRLDLALELHAVLLANLFRQGDEKALMAIDDAASLQRVCVNGQMVFVLILTKLFSNLSTFGVLPLERITGGVAPSKKEETTSLLKGSAKLVTDTIHLNATKSMTMPAAVDCWRCLRYLSATAVAVISRLGFGVAELFHTRSEKFIEVDPVSKGYYGIRLLDSEIGDISGNELGAIYVSESSVGEDGSEEASLEKRVHRRLCVNLAAQVLSLLDVFIFPDSVDVALPASQLHGLALVRNTESRIGGAQGPLLASLVRLSILLINQLEPCSVSLLQCSSRLRCFLHWIFELIHESEALEGYSAAFNKLTAPFDRLILAVVLQCHQTLRRSQLLIFQLEGSSPKIEFDDNDARKKMYRRLLRVCLETRELLVTVMDQRIDVLRSCFSSEAFETLKEALHISDPRETKAPDTHEPTNSPKEMLVHRLLTSKWVNGFHGQIRKADILLPEILQQDDQGEGVKAMRNLSTESHQISSTFEKSLNACFEKYLEAQRKWAETGAVRDLEFEGDTTLKRLGTRHTTDVGEFVKIISGRSQAAGRRWENINRKVTDIWGNCKHWELPRFTDGLGRRTFLVPNKCFNSHEGASYDLLMGKEREREEQRREERLREKQELAELMKRNAEAFVPLGGSPALDEDEERETEDHNDDVENCGSKVVQSTDSQPILTNDESEFDPTVADEIDEKTPIVAFPVEDVDAWAKAFIWSESESAVARFDSVTVVALQYVVEGKLLLTSHGLYFKQMGKGINTVTKDVFADDGASSRLAIDDDRRWRLSRLKEIHSRRYMLRAQALELFFLNDELFLNFPTGKERNRFYAKLRNSCKVQILFSPKSLNPRTIYKRSNLTELWRKRCISNFEYIMALNRMAGRTFNDIAQYPVFPWVLSDYTSEKIDLTDSRIYRDLTKPIGALNPDRLSQLLERFNELEQFGFAENERFLYGSHYSSPGVVLHFLIRQEPFTSMAIDLQSGRFDCPDRLFFDIAESWKGCNTSSSDVKELIPEFFTLPETFINTNKFPLGTTQKGIVVNDVLLPPWAKGSAHEFVRIHRLALESEYVSRNLNHWVDLIFGCKQRGPGAEAAHNIFHHLSYEGAVDLDKIADELDRRAAESHIQNFGQTPSQLLVKESHPHRLSAEECWSPMINNMSSTVRLRCHTPGKQYGGKKGGCGSAIKVGVQADSITVVYADLKVGTFRWYPRATKNRLKPNRLRVLPNRSLSNSCSVIKRGSAAPQTMGDSSNKLAVGNWSFAITLGGYEKDQMRRKALMPSRLVSAKDALYTDAASVIVSCGYWDNSIKLHSTDAWKLETVENGGHRGPIRCLAVGSDGGFMVSGGEDCTCRVWIIDHPDMAIAMADGYIQTAMGTSTYGEKILSCCHILWGHESPITCVDVSSDLDVAVSGSLGGKICLHSLRRGEFIRSIRPPSKPDKTNFAIVKIALEKHGRMVVHTSDGRLHAYTINGVCLCSTDAGERVHDIVIAGEVVVTGGDRCHVYIRDLATLKILSGLDLSRHGPVRSISMTPEELNPVPQHLFIGSDDGMISIVDRDDIRASTGR